jgi:ribosomal protein S18 acetylase RimI-like enzyme
MDKNTHQQIQQVLGEAFLDYPLMRYAFDGQSPEKYKKSVFTLYGCCANGCAAYGNTFLHPSGDGALTYLSGDSFPMGLWKELQTGFLAVPLNLGLKATLRLIRHEEEVEPWIRKNASKSMGYIWCIGVRPSAQGKGYSREMMDLAVKEMKEKGMEEIWLKTEDAKNVKIYEKLGFKVEKHVVAKSSGIDAWMMKRV